MLSRLLQGMLGTVLLALAVAVPAECLQVEGNSVDEKSTRYGITTAEWTADVRNDCDAPYDANLTVMFKDVDGRVLHKAVQFVAIRGGNRENTSRRINIPEDQFQAIDTIEVATEERERPR
ncbi:MAG: hypothetical protein WD750_06500 [Gammaproteobacteria bacterium]